jgi:hypothetical protein
MDQGDRSVGRRAPDGIGHADSLDAEANSLALQAAHGIGSRTAGVFGDVHHR